LFGKGLIGRAILGAQSRAEISKSIEFPFSWTACSRHSEELQAVQKYLLRRRMFSFVSRYEIVWTAGQSGFSSFHENTTVEMEVFRKVLSFADWLRASSPAAQHTFHLMSSAGALFEGQRCVNHASLPCSNRPYGRAKLEQERLVAAMLRDTRNVVYRPSSVYGFSGGGVRMGLVNSLIHNALRHKPTRIFADPHTIRDFVLVSDIGRFVSDQLRAADRKSVTFTLASGKPSTIFEIVRRIERVLHRKVYCNLEQAAINSADNSYSRDILPKDWKPTDLDTGIRNTIKCLTSSRPFAAPSNPCAAFPAPMIF
jgi:nucleoside-diphosphate-sugar epimerase